MVAVRGFSTRSRRCDLAGGDCTAAASKTQDTHTTAETARSLRCCSRGAALAGSASLYALFATQEEYNYTQRLGEVTLGTGCTHEQLRWAEFPALTASVTVARGSYGDAVCSHIQGIFPC